MYFARLSGIYQETFIIVSAWPAANLGHMKLKCILYSNVTTPCPVLRQEEKYTYIPKWTHQPKQSQTVARQNVVKETDFFVLQE